MDEDLDRKVGSYKDVKGSPCEACMVMDGSRKDRVIDQMVVYNTKFQIA